MNEVKEMLEVEDFGVVSEDTHGGLIGRTYDGGFGFRLP